MTKDSIEEARRSLVARLYPEGIPLLWCPTLTHFSQKGRFDTDRIRAHLRVLAPHVKGILVPGSTGEGWEISDADSRNLLSIILDIAQALNIHVLVGVLKTDMPSVLASIRDTLPSLQRRSGLEDPLQAMIHSNVTGFTVCPPKGRDLSRDQIKEALTEVLDTGLPIALYQLPQVTDNEMTPQCVAELAARYPNFYLFKDSSGHDRVALSGLDLADVFLVRGAEGQYDKWLKSATGPYDGFLLSTANCFARELAELQHLLQQGKAEQAHTLSRRLEAVIDPCFRMVERFSAGNPFTNANKVLDHVFAYGADATSKEPPLLYSGLRLPARFIQTAIHLLGTQQLFPARGYLG